MLKYLYEVYNSLKGLKKKVGAKQLGSWGETTRVCVCVGGGGGGGNVQASNLGRND